MIKKIGILVLTGALLFGGVGSAFAYDVKSGDTMYTIAKNHDLTLNQLAALNPQIKNINMIYVNQIIETNSNDSVEAVKPTSKPVQAVKEVTGVTSSDHDLLARLVRAEAQGESYIGKVAVAEVVLNRVGSSQFPNTIKGVIYQSGQFSPVSSGKINVAADAESIRAAAEALSGSNYAGDNSLFFYNASTASSRWLDGRATTTKIGNHTFKN